MTGYLCERCFKNFTRRANLERHMIKKFPCKDASQEMKILSKKLRVLTMTQKAQKIEKININSNNVNNSNNTQNIVIVNAYQNKNMDHITDQEFIRCLNRTLLCIPALIDKVHFDPNVPENHNVYISDINRNRGKSFDGKQWQNMNGDDLADKLIYQFEEVICNTIDKFSEDNPELHTKLLKKYELYEEVKETDGALENLIKEIKAILYNRKYIVKT